jgi:hypothetical protein
MPMQRKRPREREERFHFRFLERHDMFEMSDMFLLSACVLLFIGMQARKGIIFEDMAISGMITLFSLALRKECRKRPCTTRLPPGAKPLRISDLDESDDNDYFYRRFRFRKKHLVELMLLIGLFDDNAQEYKKIILDHERHYCYADTAMLIFLARMASPASFVTMMVEFGMIECRMSIAFNIMARLYHCQELKYGRIISTYLLNEWLYMAHHSTILSALSTVIF